MAQAKRQKRLFSPVEEAQVEADKAATLRALQSPHIEDKSGQRAAYRRLEKMQEQCGVPDLTPDQRTKAAVQIKQLEEEIKVGMLSHEEMRRNPPGAVDQNVWWEKRNKGRILRRRNLIRALHKGMAADESQEATTIETLRPRSSHLNMVGAQIPEIRTFSFPSDAYKESYDRIFSTTSAVGDPAVVPDVHFEEEEEVQGDLLDEDEDPSVALQELSRKKR